MPGPRSVRGAPARGPAGPGGGLAQARAQAVRQYLEGKVDSSRMFIVAPKLDAKGIEDKGATTRVDFGLK